MSDYEDAGEGLEPWAIPEEEERLRARAPKELPALAVADTATRLLAYVLQHAGFDAPHADPPPASYWRAKALLYIGALAFRVARTSLTLVAMGYTPEALGFKRTLIELHSRAQKIERDQTGEYARQWLEGRAGKPSKAVSEFTPRDLWSNLSYSAHADHRQVEQFFAVSHDDGSTSVVVAPERIVARDDGTLTLVASELRDIAVLIAKVHGARLTGIERIDAQIRALPFWSDQPDTTSKEE